MRRTLAQGAPGILIVAFLSGCATRSDDLDCDPERVYDATERKGILDDDTIDELLGVTTVIGELTVQVDDLGPMACLERANSLAIEGGRAPTLEPLHNLVEVEFLHIIGTDALTDLRGLDQLVDVDYVDLFANTNLVSTAGLSPPVELDGLSLIGNPKLEDLSAFEGTTSLGMLRVWNEGPISLAGFEALKNIKSELSIKNTTNLETLQGLEALERVGSLEAEWNLDLRSFAGLEALATIDDDLRIVTNPALTSLEGFENLQQVGGDFRVTGNGELCVTRAKELADQVDLGGSESTGQNREEPCD